MRTSKFNGKRLKDALQLRKKRMSELAEEIGVSKQSLSLYANGANIPPYENVEKIAFCLKFPYEFFMTEDDCSVTTDRTYFRSQVSAKKIDQNAQKIRMEYVARVYEVLLNYVNLPPLNLPDNIEFEFDSNPVEATSEKVANKIELIASSLRRYWKLGDGPIENIQYVLESNGIIVTGFKDVDSKIDAFSQRINVEGKGPMFIMALGIGESSQARLSFDMAHELGHILLHNWTDEDSGLTKDEFNAMEKQANMFASAFLLPRESFIYDVEPYATNVEFYRNLKKKWGVSMMAMMYRARSLDVIKTDRQFQYMMRTMAAKGFSRKHEPGDYVGTLHKTLFQESVRLLLDENYFTAKGMVDMFSSHGICLSVEDLEDIMGLDEGTLSVSTTPTNLIRLKTSHEG